MGMLVAIVPASLMPDRWIGVEGTRFWSNHHNVLIHTDQYSAGQAAAQKCRRGAAALANARPVGMLRPQIPKSVEVIEMEFLRSGERDYEGEGRS